MNPSCAAPIPVNLGIAYLERLWEKAMGTLRQAPLPELCRQEHELDHVLLNCIGLDIVEPYKFLYGRRPSFAEFSAWIVQTLGAPPSAPIVSRANQIVADFMAGNFGTYPAVESIEQPALTPEELRFWDDNGYVVLRNAISRADAEASAQVVWDFLGLDPAAPDSWYQREQTFWADLFHHPVLRQNRHSPRMRKAFAQLWGTENLITSVNRVSFNPPLREGCDHSGPSRLHWDTSLVPPLQFEVVGILYLNDVADDQGAFRCIPGFHRNIENWLTSLPEHINPREVDLEALGPVSIGGKAGDMVIWREELPHGSGKNYSQQPRLAQYISMYPPDRRINPHWR